MKRHIITLLAVLVGCLTADATTGILLVHYGTQNDGSRAQTIDLLNREVADAFSQCPVVEAYAAPTVIKALAKRGIRKLTVGEALDSLSSLGCRQLVVESTMLLDGVMTDMLTAAVNNRRNLFDKVSVDRPLLYSVDDCRNIISMIEKHLTALGKYQKDKSQVVLVGHGSDSPANAMYSQIDYLLHDEGHAQWHVGTIEGYPTVECVERRLSASKEKDVILVPLLYIAGNHQREDIGGAWREALSAKGYHVSVVDEGLGQMKEIRQMIVQKVRALIQGQQ